VVRSFTKSSRCDADRGEEFAEIDANRSTYRSTSSNIDPATVKVQFASLPCSDLRDAKPARACRPPGTACVFRARPAHLADRPALTPIT
jgi:hypothetical protein